ncbi:helix-turn-helix transcriptional regulator [Lysinibacillus pakistanensis]|uniref:Helix-turn-helix transcriptional regulator n=1 Tax=Lysinibacillus pakistanensis TaxID=759811 RepID=A0AAX3WZV1_9BACI|nr:helix-turn-helix transcriptional regulator [Lysinibacillus pakistanensis]MDM5231441.1 helix-turn-helix transcriptional regulator [Lysinibacillus pakistanensis]WHY46988.1 helix-turn-helix transcriptional regulator [Lysinibacillus pakistanensis]WHY52000.1 helix-turn-helix transcriptional regulator [Lysinibacillus pakistanensis]
MQWNLLMLRKKNKLYQEHVAKVLGISVGSYGMKERGEVEFTADEMFKLRDYFNMSIEQIFLPRNLGDTEFYDAR